MSLNKRIAFGLLYIFNINVINKYNYNSLINN